MQFILLIRSFPFLEGKFFYRKYLPIINIEEIIEYFTVNEIIERVMENRIFTRYQFCAYTLFVKCQGKNILFQW